MCQVLPYVHYDLTVLREELKEVRATKMLSWWQRIWERDIFGVMVRNTVVLKGMWVEGGLVIVTHVWDTDRGQQFYCDVALADRCISCVGVVGDHGAHIRELSMTFYPRPK